MQRTAPRLALAAGVVAVLLAGCGKATDSLAPAAGPGASNERNESEIASVLGSVPELAEDGLYMSEEETTIEASVSGSGIVRPGADVLAPIRPLRYWRRITSVDRRFEFEFARPDTNGDPQYAIVTIHKLLKGTFNILTPVDDDKGDGTIASTGGDDPADPRDLEIVRKRLADHWVRRILLKRTKHPDTDRMLWRVAATSGVSVSSVQPQDSKKAPTTIVSLQVRTSSMDTTITNPLHFVHLRRILKLTPHEKVGLTVTTESKDDIVVLLHRGHRFRFRNNGDGTHSGVWEAPRVLGIHHFGVNALSRGTLFDDEAPYCSDAWILPYASVPVAVDYMP